MGINKNIFNEVYDKLLKIFPKRNIPIFLFDHLKDSKSVLDVGCGRFSPLQDINLPIYKVGIDFYEPYIKISKSNHTHDKYVVHDIRKKFPFKDDSFDSVIATEVLEHLKKEEGLALLKEIERVARKNIILTTPNGFIYNDVYRPQDNPEERHLSGWKVEELNKLGFTVCGLNGFKFLRGSDSVVKFRPKTIFEILTKLSRYLVYHHPQLAFQLYFYKYLNKV